MPTRADLEKLGDQVALGDAISQWEAAHQPEKPRPRGGFELPPRPRSRWRSPLVIRTAVVATAGLVGVISGKLLLPRADAQSSDGVLERPWLAVTDSVTRGVNNTIYRVTDENRRTLLTAADVAALIFRSPRRRTVFVDSITARADSMLSIRGRLAQNATFEVRGDLHMIRRGMAELVVRSLKVGDVDLDPMKTSRLFARGRARTEDSDRLRFEVPLNMTRIAVVVGGSIAVTRDQYPEGTSNAVVR